MANKEENGGCGNVTEQEKAAGKGIFREDLKEKRGPLKKKRKMVLGTGHSTTEGPKMRGQKRN